MVESSVLFPVASVSSLEENGTSVLFSCSGDYYLTHQPMPPSPSSGVSQLKLQKRHETSWLHADWSVIVCEHVDWILACADGANTRGWSCVVIRRDSGRAIAVCCRVWESLTGSRCPLNREPLRVVETDEWALKLKAKPNPEIPAERQRDIHELTHLPPVPWCPACVSRKAADDPRRRRQDARDFGLDVASFDHNDISAKVGMFNKKLKFKVW